MVELGSGALITDSASGSRSGLAGLLGQIAGPEVGVGVSGDGRSVVPTWPPEGIAGVGAGMTESGKTARTAGLCLSAAACAEVTDATTNGSALPAVMFVAPWEPSVWTSGATSALTARVAARTPEPAALSRSRTMTFVFDPLANGMPWVVKFEGSDAEAAPAASTIPTAVPTNNKPRRVTP